MHRRYRDLPAGARTRPLTRWEIDRESQRLYARKLNGEIDSATFLREQAALWEQLPSV